MDRFRRAAALLFLLPSLFAAASRAAEPEPDILSAARECAEDYALPLSLLLAVCETESGFDPASGNGTCEGLMGLHRDYAGAYARLAGLEDYDLHDIRDNLRIGACILADYCARYDLHRALMCYNLGERGARESGLSQTRYSRLVCERMARYEESSAVLPAGRPEAPDDPPLF